jgi:hypothetical protein
MPFGLISELKSEINSIIKSNDSNDTKKKTKAEKVLVLLNSLQSSLLEYKSEDQVYVPEFN